MLWKSQRMNAQKTRARHVGLKEDDFVWFDRQKYKKIHDGPADALLPLLLDRLRMQMYLLSPDGGDLPGDPRKYNGIIYSFDDFSACVERIKIDPTQQLFDRPANPINADTLYSDVVRSLTVKDVQRFNDDFRYFNVNIDDTAWSQSPSGLEGKEAVIVNLDLSNSEIEKAFKLWLSLTRNAQKKQPWAGGRDSFMYRCKDFGLLAKFDIEFFRLYRQESERRRNGDSATSFTVSKGLFYKLAFPSGTGNAVDSKFRGVNSVMTDFLHSLYFRSMVLRNCQVQY
jgi:hypothetical protein